MAIRPAAVAGSFYPDNPSILTEDIQRYMSAATSSTQAEAIIAPHAGYQYSGPIAANAYQAILHRKKVIKRVVILGPAHRVYVTGLALSSADAFATPLGRIALDKTAQLSLLHHHYVNVNDAAHEQEHCIEVHLPFLQQILPVFSLIPIVVGEASPTDVYRVIEDTWSDETLIIVSSDLSHFLDYDTARQHDQKTTSAITQYNTAAIGPTQACGCRPLNGLLQFAQQHAYQIKTLDLRNSGDTAGDKDRVVGYGAYAIC